MGWNLIGVDEKEYTSGQLSVMLNDERGTNYPSLAAGITALGIGVVTTAIFSRYVHQVDEKVSDILAGVGILITLIGIDAMLEENSDKIALQGALSMAAATNGTVTVTTKIYQWESGSGNSYTWKSETSYRYNKY